MHQDDSPTDTPDSPAAATSVARRRALGLGLTAAVAGLATVVGADPASAASGDALLIGTANDADADPTSLVSTTTDGVLAIATPDLTTPTAMATLAKDTTGIEVSGTIAVDATGTSTGVVAGGPTAVSATGTGATSTGVTATGVTAVDATGTTTGVSAAGPTGVSASGTGAGGVGVSAATTGNTSTAVSAAASGTGSIGVDASGPTAVSAVGTTTGVGASGPTAVNAAGSTIGVVASGPTALDANGTSIGVDASGPTAVNAVGTSFGVDATGGAAGIGGRFGGTRANLLLTPGSSAPPAVAHSVGEIYVTTAGGIQVCVIAGNPGTFVRLGFNPVAPFRACDTRPGFGGLHSGQTLGPNGNLDLLASSVPGIPTAGVSVIVFNLTMATCTADGWLTAFPTGSPLPLASNVNFAALQSPKANLVVCGLGTGGNVRINNANGSTNIIVDVFGFYS